MDDDLIDKLLAWAKVPADPLSPTETEKSRVPKLRVDLALLANDVGESVLRYRSDFKVRIDDTQSMVRATKLVTLCRLVGNNADFGDKASQRALRLSRWYRLFGNKDPLVKKLFPDPKVLCEMLDEIFDTAQSISPAFRSYCGGVDGAAENVYAMREAMQKAGKARTMVYNVIHFMHQNGLDAGTLTGENIVSVMAMASKAPPYQAFAGYAAWGAGNHKDAEENKRMHFQKHVLDAHTSDKEKLEWHDECPIWWKTLGIQLTRKDAMALASTAMAGKLKPMFPGGTADTDLLPLGKVVAAVKASRDVGGWGQPLLNHLYDSYGDIYVNAALTMSRNMTHVLVHSVPRKPYAAFLKGVNGDCYIGGRIEGDELTISTCFVPKPDVDKATLHEDRKFWTVAPL